MKKTDLEKNKALKLEGLMRQAPLPSRFGQQSQTVPDRRAQRKLDQERGLVPFAVKINGALVQQLRAEAEKSGTEMGDLVEALLHQGLEARLK